MKGLTKRQQEVLDFIEDYVSHHGYPPSVRNIAAHLSLVSASGVHKHIKALVRKNYLTKQEFTSRSLRVVRRGGAAGSATETIPWKVLGLLDERGIRSEPGKHPNTLRIPTAWFGRSIPGHALIVNTLAFAVRGIRPGDALLIAKDETETAEDLILAKRSETYTLLNGAEASGLRTGERYGVVLGLWRRYRGT